MADQRQWSRGEWVDTPFAPPCHGAADSDASYPPMSHAGSLPFSQPAMPHWSELPTEDGLFIGATEVQWAKLMQEGATSLRAMLERISLAVPLKIGVEGLPPGTAIVLKRTLFSWCRDVGRQVHIYIEDAVAAGYIIEGGVPPNEFVFCAPRPQPHTSQPQMSADGWPSLGGETKGWERMGWDEMGGGPSPGAEVGSDHRAHCFAKCVSEASQGGNGPEPHHLRLGAGLVSDGLGSVGPSVVGGALSSFSGVASVARPDASCVADPGLQAQTHMRPMYPVPHPGCAELSMADFGVGGSSGGMGGADLSMGDLMNEMRQFGMECAADGGGRMGWEGDAGISSGGALGGADFGSGDDCGGGLGRQSAFAVSGANQSGQSGWQAMPPAAGTMLWGGGEWQSGRSWKTKETAALRQHSDTPSPMAAPHIAVGAVGAATGGVSFGGLSGASSLASVGGQVGCRMGYQ
jgi:hypothetical protein